MGNLYSLKVHGFQLARGFFVVGFFSVAGGPLDPNPHGGCGSGFPKMILFETETRNFASISSCFLMLPVPVPVLVVIFFD